MTLEEKARLKAQLLRIFDAVIEGNGYESRNAELTGDKPTFFLWFFGNINRLEVDIHRNGWSKGKEREAETIAIYTDKPIPDEQIETLLNRIKEVTDGNGHHEEQPM